MNTNHTFIGRSIQVVLLSFCIGVVVVPLAGRTGSVLPGGQSYMAQSFSGGAAWARARHEPLQVITSKGEITLDVEVARTPEEKALGLMFRASLSDQAGMLFAYERDQEITMWMKNTFIPLDMVFIRSDGVIGHIAVMTEPLSEEIVASKGAAKYVLEIAGGAAGRLGIKIGDKVRHNLIGQ